MTPEEQQTIKAHANAIAIAAILYQNTDTEKLQSLEDIEKSCASTCWKALARKSVFFYRNKNINVVPSII
ncbi:MAG: hypothetical protein WCD18_14700 [Thermosynechococcaceae cyanobacterium]